MADYIPFVPGDTNYRLVVPLDNIDYLFDVRWNSRDNVDPVTGEARGAYYFDLREADETIIEIGIKVVLGVRLGRTSTHPFFDVHVLQPIDLSGQGKDAGYDELGTRVQVLHMKLSEFKRSV